MRRFPHLRLALGFAIVCLARTGHAADGPSYTPVLMKGGLAHPTRLLAKVKLVAAVSAHASTLAARGLHAVRGYALVPGLVVLDTDPQAQAMAAAGATSTGMSAAQLQAQIAALRASGLFEYVEPDYLFYADATPNDAAFVDGRLWGLRNTGQSGGTPGVDIDAERAWDLTTGSPGVIVGVIDTGIRYTHLDLAANMWRNPTEVAGNGLDDDGNGYIDDVFGINAITGTGNPMDDDGHGTHVAGTIGAAANNGQPHVGVAWNVRLMALKFIPANSSGATSDAIECVNYAVAKGATILNNSWGNSGGRSQSLLEAITIAQNQGVLFVAAAGNDGTDNDATPHYPSSYDLDNVISVAAIDRYGSRASFSNFGSRSVDLGAPGAAIYSTIHTSDTSYDTYQGTSMAAPHVSGVAALIRAQFPTITLADLRDRLLNTTTPTPLLQGSTVTGGRVNAYQALALQGDGKLEVSVSPPSGTTFYHGRATPVVVRVTDLIGVTGATVTGTIDGGGAVTFLDNGVAPDVVANDSRYTGTVDVPATGTQLTLSVDASAPAKTAAQASVTYTLQAPPPNDHFANRIALTFNNGSTTANNTGATLEPGEPVIAGEQGGASLWWTWTAPANTTVTVSTEGSNFDTLLGVYTGSGVNALTEIASNDDISGPNQPSKVTFTATAGTVYQIVVDGWEGKTGGITLNLTANLPPSNDNFTDRITLSGTSFTVNATNNFATREAGEPVPPTTSGDDSVWWTWTAPADSTAIIRTWSNDLHARDVEVYTGSSLASLVRLPGYTLESALATERWKLTFGARAGTTYQIAVSNESNVPTGSFRLELTTAEGPAHDHFENRMPISGATAAIRTSSQNATRELGEPVTTSTAAGASVWWTWTAPADGVAFVFSTGAAFDKVIAVFTGASLDDLTTVGVAAVRGATERGLAFPTVAGRAYHISVDGTTSFTATGEYYLNLDSGTPPANDAFAQRIALNGSWAVASGSPRLASREPEEVPIALDASGATVWWTWTAPDNGTAIVAADYSDVLIGVYTGNTFGALTAVTANYLTFGAGRRIIFQARAGVSYAIAVDGIGGERPPFSLVARLVTSPPNDLFADRAPLTGTAVVLDATNLDATVETGEPSASDPDSHDSASIWWTWTSPASLWADLSVTSEGFKPTLRVVKGSVVDALEIVAADLDDSPGSRTSRVRFHARVGQTYQIAVAGAGGATGPIRLALSTSPAPEVSINGAQVPVWAGTSVKLQAEVSGTGPFTYQWVLDGSDIVEATTMTLALPSAQLFHSGNYSLRIGDALGEITTEPVELGILSPLDAGARLTNLSTRALALTGDNVLIPGFVIAGPGNKQLLIRAVGPTLAGFGVAGTLPDPRLTLKRWNGTAYVDVATNDNWGTNPNAAAIITKSADLFAFPLNTGSADAALLVDLPPGQYSAVAGDAGTQTGIAIVELYDADPSTGSTGSPQAGSGQAPTSRLINISNRGFVGGGDSIMIPGFVVSSEGPKTLLIRAVGPTLATFGVSGVLADPTLSIYRRNQTTNTDELILTNDDWSIGPGAARTRDVAAQIQAFALPGGSKDAAFVVTLNPGIYTVHARGANATTGVALVEVYAVP